MSDKQYTVMSLYLGFLVSILFAVFWGIWHLSGHQVPAYTNLELMNKLSLTFQISRWWDILFVFFIVNTYTWTLRVYYKFGLKSDSNKDNLAFGLFWSLVISFILIDFNFNIIPDIITINIFIMASLIAGLIVCFIFSPVFGLNTGIGVGLGSCLGVNFGFYLKIIFLSLIIHFGIIGLFLVFVLFLSFIIAFYHFTYPSYQLPVNKTEILADN